MCMTIHANEVMTSFSDFLRLLGQPIATLRTGGVGNDDLTANPVDSKKKKKQQQKAKLYLKIDSRVSRSVSRVC